VHRRQLDSCIFTSYTYRYKVPDKEAEKMKKYITAVILLCGMGHCFFAVDWQKELFAQFIQKETFEVRCDWTQGFKRIERELEACIENLEGRLYTTERFGISDFTLTENGFLAQKVPVHNHKTKEDKKIDIFFVLGNEYLLFFTSMENFNSGYFLTMATPYIFKQREKSDFWELINKQKRYVDSSPYSGLIKKTTTSSYMTETVKGVSFPYNGSDFELYILQNEVGSSLNMYAMPWVENVAGGGIGEWIEIEPDMEQSVCYILNGFVDASRPHLYKMNSRIKKALVTGITAKGKELDQTVYFEDFVYFKTIQFTKPVVKIRITIQDVYPGTKWQDTAISAIMFPEYRNKAKDWRYRYNNDTGKYEVCKIEKK